MQYISFEVFVEKEQCKTNHWANKVLHNGFQPNFAMHWLSSSKMSDTDSICASKAFLPSQQHWNQGNFVWRLPITWLIATFGATLYSINFFLDENKMFISSGGWKSKVSLFGSCQSAPWSTLVHLSQQPFQRLSPRLSVLANRWQDYPQKISNIWGGLQLTWPDLCCTLLQLGWPSLKGKYENTTDTSSRLLTW